MQKSVWGKGLLAISIGALSALTSGCLDRPLCSDDCQPNTTNQFVLRVPTGGIKKIDFLFMIDNSGSMADKQRILKSAVPALVSRFVKPLCVDDKGNPNGSVLEAGHCASGAPEFPPINDIHVGVITSSLGAAGGVNECQVPPALNGRADNDDRAWLLPKARAGSNLPSWDNSGFLAWDPLGTANQPKGSSDRAQLSTDFQNLVAAAGETGCGYEASLESWYRFLIDPDPSTGVTIQTDHGVRTGLDQELLNQRAKFLRPDSLVAIVMLTDENDCSARAAGQGFLVSDWERAARSTAVCAQKPNDPCCRPCQAEKTPPAGCGTIADDAECKKGNQLEEADDSKNLRCADEKRRFGFDLLEPTSKYVRGLTQKTVPDRDGVERPNPLFAGGRTPDLVYLAGIVGVPWQDIATEDSLTGPGLRYLTAEELKAKGRWDVILGDPATGKRPSDPHMIESSKPRSGSHPFLPQAAIAPTDAPTPQTDVISGHEQQSNDDLNYACIFELETPRSCQGVTSCDCANDADLASKRPLCQPPSGGALGRTQYYAKAYPGTRHLEVLRGIGDQAIVASICPKVSRSNTPDSDVNFGYNPAMDALVKRLRPALADQCLGRAPEVDDSGRTSCVVLEAQIGGECACNTPGRSVPEAGSMNAVRDEFKAGGFCDTPNGPACSQVCACQVAEAQGSALTSCRSTTDPSVQSPAYCYVDPDKGLGDPSLVSGCPKTKRRLLRFVGADTPRSGTIAYMACMGKTLQQ
ncbi:MAG TPA: hypothetical protein VG937_01705 [Polyangiaceae bacterium]|nr:hypothetical protein [Polyangiaceae bacterium]